jgi:hypothetical protein
MKKGGVSRMDQKRVERILELCKQIQPMEHERKWQILNHIAGGGTEETLDPPITPEERPFWDLNKEYYDDCIGDLPPGKTFMFVPPNDPDLEDW